jgi:high-affinity nickel-transport protein
MEASQANPPKAVDPFANVDYRRLAALYAFVAGLHVLGWGLFALEAARLQNLAYSGAGAVAYFLGLRHAFDADHIAAIDDTTRLLLRKGRLPLAVGFFFSLGHASVVLVLSAGVAFAARFFALHVEALRQVGDVLGSLVSSAFLLVVAVLNLLVWLELFRSDPRESQTNTSRGLLGLLLSTGVMKVVQRDWQMYLVGLLFGLGFDTASEIGLLGLTASTSRATSDGLSAGAVLALPLLFAAGMCLLDTTDGVLMARAYAWAARQPERRRLYNLLTTGLSVIAAFVVAAVELVTLWTRHAGTRGGLAELVERLSQRFEAFGVFIVATFMVLWAGAVFVSHRRQVSRRNRTSSVGCSFQATEALPCAPDETG